jgi:hypothetical protein
VSRRRGPALGSAATIDDGAPAGPPGFFARQRRAHPRPSSHARARSPGRPARAGASRAAPRPPDRAWPRHARARAAAASSRRRLLRPKQQQAEGGRLHVAEGVHSRDPIQQAALHHRAADPRHGPCRLAHRAWEFGGGAVVGLARGNGRRWLVWAGPSFVYVRAKQTSVSGLDGCFRTEQSPRRAADAAGRARPTDHLPPCRRRRPGKPTHPPPHALPPCRASSGRAS